MPASQRSEVPGTIVEALALAVNPSASVAAIRVRTSTDSSSGKTTPVEL
jgi:hypothetical protein